ncbi:hypothetical protein HYPSUDRAFT_652761 [Hypholoma sublateritium FD-334 SS-4]|uniref:F-box domain-containing protein n=1 Tax=Hypholoma sublateritium (strain FD-334 SS-4) TaxID=945553 RepID=A0A0D2NUK2_HYPSF|nr:hypothetical protein HYPSUDRAFT_652761 [Hypholoma sublateritium FD-334 SS-4]
MDRSPVSNNSAMEALLKTNRPPTDKERMIQMLQDSISADNKKLKALQGKIYEAIAHTQQLKPQKVARTKIKLRHLRREESAILETSTDHRRVFSPFTNLPEDVIREIFAACVEDNIPILSFGTTPFPYILAQISSGMRHIALTTPCIWASMNVRTNLFYFGSQQPSKKDYAMLASKVSQWFDRADVQNDPSNILFDTLLSYSSRWKRIQLESIYGDVPSAPLVRIAALTAVDVPLLESITLCFQSGSSVFRNSPILKIPTLRRLTLDTHWNQFNGTIISQFTVNWTNLTYVTIHGGRGNGVSSIDEIAQILRKTKRLVFCDIAVGTGSEHLLGKIDLPLLEMLCVDDKRCKPNSSGVPSIFDSINAPVLVVLKIRAKFLDIPLADFFGRTPAIRELSLSHLNSEKSLADITNLLRHCPSLSVLTLHPPQWSRMNQPYDANMFLRTFVEDVNGGVGITCPRLEYFNFTGAVNFSLQTLSQFLEAKQRGTAPVNGLLPWERVKIDMWGIHDLERSQKLDLVSEKRAAGLDVYIYVKDYVYG